jgi:hypothetical protein
LDVSSIVGSRNPLAGRRDRQSRQAG